MERHVRHREIGRSRPRPMDDGAAQCLRGLPEGVRRGPRESPGGRHLHRYERHALDGGGPGGSYRLHEWYGGCLAAAAASSQVARSPPLPFTVLCPWNILALRDDSRVLALGEGGVGNMPATRQ